MRVVGPSTKWQFQGVSLSSGSDSSPESSPCGAEDPAAEVSIERRGERCPAPDTNDDGREVERSTSPLLSLGAASSTESDCAEVDVVGCSEPLVRAGSPV